MNAIVPPQSSETTAELIQNGTWTCKETDQGYEILTTPYSSCCNPFPQSKWTLDKKGNILGHEDIIIPGVKYASRLF